MRFVMAPKSQENGNDTSDSSRPSSKDPMADPPKPTSKMIRVLTVFVYVLSVSLTAILLSIYYIFMWEGKPHLGALVAQGSQNNTEQHADSFKQHELSPHFERQQQLQYLVENLETTSTENFPSIKAELDLNSTIYEVFDDNSTERILLAENRTQVAEMQQQLIAAEVEPIEEQLVPTTTSIPDDIVPPIEEYDIDSSEELRRTSPLIEKIMAKEGFPEQDKFYKIN